MRKKTIGPRLLALAMLTAVLSIAANANAQERGEKPENAGPPAWVIAAWESGEAPVPPADGPPAWVVESWQNGQRPQRLQRPAGPPAWVLARQEMAKELGLPGPPDEVLEAWKSGNGFDLPGPPDFVLNLFGF